MNNAILVVALAAGIAAAGDAMAQQAVPANERYCVEVLGFDGPNPWLCRFSTYEQCVASKTSPVDRCWLNPRLGFQPRR